MDFMQIVKDVDALVLFYFIIGFSAYGITSTVFGLFHWVREKCRRRKKTADTENNKDIAE